MFPMIVLVVALAAYANGQFPTGTCPFECNCNNTETICTSQSMFPTGISESALYFELRDSNIQEIRHGAFDNQRQLQRIKIVSSNITKLSACSFSNLQNLVKIEIVNSTVRIIEGNAFSHLTNITQIVFHDSRVGTIDSYAFHNVEGVDKFLFERNEIETISPHAFMNISRTANYKIMYNKIRLINSGVIKSMYAVTNFNFTGNSITDMFCGNQDALLESNATAQVFNNTFNCSCTLAWIFSLPANDYKTINFKEQNYCNDTQRGELIQLSKLQLSPLCEENVRCPMQSPILPYKDCMINFDKPLNPVDKVDYPNKDRKPSGQTAVVITFFQMLILVVFLLLIS
ncbi:hypothetical protein CHS0354_017357 [Potamilus streckersoni]|uniref:Uncharacterized protein n=1 Tax=Potamilus streckersoni TaxID=2493646 RepID=A0AAE0T4V6_9BIVA|nr:hypothetical protein CHS0354_017357 [Potamilus streckersoni]